VGGAVNFVLRGAQFQRRGLHGFLLCEIVVARLAVRGADPCAVGLAAA
jgi:hypothetical protein